MKSNPNEEINFQIGKAGLTEGTIQALNTLLEKHKRIRISILKSAQEERQDIKFLSQDLISKLKAPCVAKSIGFTIILKRISEQKAHQKRQKKK